MSEIPAVDLHLQLQKSQFKVPNEVIKKNFKNIQKLVEKQNQTLSTQMKALSAPDVPPDQKRALVKKMIQTQELYQKKLGVRVEQHNELVTRLDARIGRLKRLDEIKRKYEALEKTPALKAAMNEELTVWYKEQINLLIAGYLVKTSGNASAAANPGLRLLESMQMEKLLDYDVILQGLHIYNEIKNNNNLQVLIDWCNDNKKTLKKVREESLDKKPESLDFETYFQKFIELIKSHRMYEALDVAKNFLVGSASDDDNLEKIQSAAGLLLFNSINIEPVLPQPESPLSFYDPNKAAYSKINMNLKQYKDLLSPEKWETLADFFLYNYNLIYGIEQNIEFLVTLSIGISTLKTKSCLGPDYVYKPQTDTEDRKRLLSKIIYPPTMSHSASHRSNPQEVNFNEFAAKVSGEKNSETSVHAMNNCPVCSQELFALSSLLPSSHQIKSNIFENPVKLPNGNIYNLDKLLKLNELNHSSEVFVLDREDILQMLKKRRVAGRSTNSAAVAADDDDYAETYSYGTDGDSIDWGTNDEAEEGEEMDEDEEDEEEAPSSPSDDAFRSEEARGKLGRFATRIKDPVTGEVFGRDDLVKVFPT